MIILLSVVAQEGNGMPIQQSVAQQPKPTGLEAGARHRYYLSSGPGHIQVCVKEFDGMPLMVVDVSHTHHRAIKDRCKTKLRPLSSATGVSVGEILVVQANRLGPLKLAFHRYVEGRLHPEGARIETADLGRVVNSVG